MLNQYIHTHGIYTDMVKYLDFLQNEYKYSLFITNGINVIIKNMYNLHINN